MPLAPAWPWLDLIVAFADFVTAVRFADALARQDGIAEEADHAARRPDPRAYFRPLRGRIPKGRELVLRDRGPLAAVPSSTSSRPGRASSCSTRGGRAQARAMPVFELSWNHTTLHALKIDRTVTYLQVLYPPPDHVARASAMHEHFGEEVTGHLELVRYDGQVAGFGLPLVRYTSEARLEEIIRHHEGRAARSSTRTPSRSRRAA